MQHSTGFATEMKIEQKKNHGKKMFNEYEIGAHAYSICGELREMLIDWRFNSIRNNNK